MTTLLTLSISLVKTTDSVWKCFGPHNHSVFLYNYRGCMETCSYYFDNGEAVSDEFNDMKVKKHSRETELNSDIDNLNTKQSLLKQSNITCEHNDTVIRQLDSTKCKLDAGKVAISSYVFYLIGFIMLFLITVIIVLGVLFYRTKMNEYKVFLSPVTPNTTLNVDVARKYIKQSSQELNLVNINSETKTDTVPRDCELYDESETTMSPKNPLKIYRSVKKPVNHQMLLREQMKKICEDALAKSQNCGLTASLKDLNQLLYEFDNDKHEKSYESIVREKSASYPQLDIYDEPPAKKHPIGDNEVDIPVYDCLPTSNSIVVQDYETNYFMTLSKDNGTEPAYINAKFRYK
ncbi:unnamed protein product [Diatraea saccharalis]|uniref:Uncharacterized protein n=1 Tax=Diatraea saccharalis TaxID=40085 RepID=A0A9N9R2D9_9NEOP|nr:unnamed protein product [Diatraea saccharalis]